MQKQSTRKRKRHIQLYVHLAIIVIVGLVTIQLTTCSEVNVSYPVATTIHAQEFKIENMETTSSTEVHNEVVRAYIY